MCTPRDRLIRTITSPSPRQTLRPFRVSSMRSRDLSYNNLTGPVPDILAELPFLEVLNLSSNQLIGSIPSAFLVKSQNGLTVRFILYHVHVNNILGLYDNRHGCSKQKSKTEVNIIHSLGPYKSNLIFAHFRCGTNWGVTQVKGFHDGSLQLESRQFTYMELKNITNFGKFLIRVDMGLSIMVI
ncbi:unnamed protein product [Musa acuminata subsp. burmannicoides]